MVACPHYSWSIKKSITFRKKIFLHYILSPHHSTANTDVYSHILFESMLYLILHAKQPKWKTKMFRNK